MIGGSVKVFLGMKLTMEGILLLSDPADRAAVSFCLLPPREYDRVTDEVGSRSVSVVTPKSGTEHEGLSCPVTGAMVSGRDLGCWEMRGAVGAWDVSPVPLMCISRVRSSGRKDFAAEAITAADSEASLGTRRFGSQVIAVPILSETEESETEGGCVEMRTQSAVGDGHVNPCA